MLSPQSFCESVFRRERKAVTAVQSVLKHIWSSMENCRKKGRREKKWHVGFHPGFPMEYFMLYSQFNTKAHVLMPQQLILVVVVW